MRIILASGSPRRQELLKYIIPKFEVIVSQVDESLQQGITLKQQSERLAYIKAKEVFDRTEGNRIIIASDTIVYKDNVYYGKPKNKQDAYNMLKILNGTSNKVATGISILIYKDGKYIEYNDCEMSKVFIHEMFEEEILEWIDSGEALDKAGAYAIQGTFGKFIDKIEGNYYSVVGLPINKIYQIIKRYL